MPAPSRKPLLRPRNVALLALALGLAWIGREVYRAVTAKPGTAIDYQQKFVDLAESYQKQVATEPNGWPILLDAIAILDETEKEALAAAGGEAAKPADWPINWAWPADYSAVFSGKSTPKVIDQTLGVMQDLRRAGVYDKLAELAAARHVVRPKQQGRLIDVLLPELGRMRQLARLGVARMRLAQRAGDSEALAAAFEQTLAVGRVAASQSTLIDRLVGVAIMELATFELRDQLSLSPPDGPTARALLGAMQRQTDGLPNMTLALEGERICGLDVLQWTYTDDGHGSGRIILSEATSIEGGSSWTGGSRASIINMAGIVFPRKADAVAKANEFYDALVNLAAMPREKRVRATFDPERFIDRLPRGHIVLRQIIPAVGKALQTEDRFQTELAGTRAMLALEVYRAEHGEYPAAITDLVPSVVPSVPVDAYSGKPFCYHRLAKGEDPLGRGYELYSVGADGKDDAGAGAPAADAFSGRNPGTDFIMNAPKEEPK